MKLWTLFSQRHILSVNFLIYTTFFTYENYRNLIHKWYVGGVEVTFTVRFWKCQGKREACEMAVVVVFGTNDPTHLKINPDYMEMYGTICKTEL